MTELSLCLLQAMAQKWRNRGLMILPCHGVEASGRHLYRKNIRTYGKNTILKGINSEDDTVAKKHNAQIGWHYGHKIYYKV